MWRGVVVYTTTRLLHTKNSRALNSFAHLALTPYPPCRLQPSCTPSPAMLMLDAPWITNLPKLAWALAVQGCIIAATVVFARDLATFRAKSAQPPSSAEAPLCAPHQCHASGINLWLLVACAVAYLVLLLACSLDTVLSLRRQPYSKSKLVRIMYSIQTRELTAVVVAIVLSIVLGEWDCQVSCEGPRGSWDSRSLGLWPVLDIPFWLLSCAVVGLNMQSCWSVGGTKGLHDG